MKRNHDRNSYFFDDVKTLANKMYFNKWLCQFKNENTVRGKLARIVLNDENYPKFETSHFAGLDYLISINSDSELIKCYHEAWQEYRQLGKVKTDENMIITKKIFYYSKKQIPNSS